MRKQDGSTKVERNKFSFHHERYKCPCSRPPRAALVKYSRDSGAGYRLGGIGKGMRVILAYSDTRLQ